MLKNKKGFRVNKHSIEQENNKIIKELREFKLSQKDNETCLFVLNNEPSLEGQQILINLRNKYLYGKENKKTDIDKIRLRTEEYKKEINEILSFIKENISNAKTKEDRFLARKYSSLKADDIKSIRFLHQIYELRARML